MSPRERFERYKSAVLAHAQAEAEEKIARALLSFDFGEIEGERYEVTIPHDEAAKEAGVTTRTVIRWIKDGELRALPKGEDERKYRIPVKEWIRFKKLKGIE